MRVLVTGIAGFIGSRVGYELLARGDEVIGIDNVNDYYSTDLKLARVDALLTGKPGFEFREKAVEDLDPTDPTLQADAIIHLAAQAGARHSLTHPRDYISSNLVGFGRVLELARQSPQNHLVFASSSSVYGANEQLPFAVTDAVNHPVSPYAATKRANELMAYSYSHLFDIPMTGLRLFTVYGPWGRPDMAMFSFTEKILAGQPIQLYGEGQLTRDFTYISDVANGILKALDKRPARSTGPVGTGINEGSAPFRVFNIGGGQPVMVADLVRLLEKALGREAECELVQAQPGDVDHTSADISSTKEWCDYQPVIPIAEGVSQFVSWYRSFYQV